MGSERDSRLGVQSGFGRAVLPAAVAGLLCAIAPAQAINVLVLSSGDPALDAAVQDLLTAHGHTATIGPAVSQFTGASLSNIDAVYMQGVGAWTDMPVIGQQVLHDWVHHAGGGLVTSEPVLYRANEGALQVLRAVFPAETTGARYEDTTLTFEQVDNDPILTAGLATSFAFSSNGGTDILPAAVHPGAIGVYETVGAGLLTYGLVAGPAGSGFVANLGADAGSVQVADANFGRLLVNSAVWSSAGQTPPGTNLSAYASLPACTLTSQSVTCSVIVLNSGSEISGPVTLTINVPEATAAAYASATPAPTVVTPTTLTFELDPLASGAVAPVSIDFIAAAGGTVALTATATTTIDVDTSNNSAAASGQIVHVSVPQDTRLESGDAPELEGQAPGTGPLTVIEGLLDGVEADVYKIRVYDWASFSVTTRQDAEHVDACGDIPSDDTAVFLFDAAGAGIAFNEDGCGSRGCLEAGNPAYANRTNGEDVLLAVAPFGYVPTSAALRIWNEEPWDVTRAPDGPGAGGMLDGWSGTGVGGTYRLEMSGASGGLVAGTDVWAFVEVPGCAFPGPMTCSVLLANFGSDTSGPVTLTVDLPDARVAAYASATPPPTVVTPATLTFDLAPLPRDAVTSVSIEFIAAAGGPAAMTATASTTSDVAPDNNTATAMINVAHGEIGDAPELAGGQLAGSAGPLTVIEGRLDGTEADMYRIRVDDWAAFSASAAAAAPCNGERFFDTALFLFDSDGYGIAHNDDSGVGPDQSSWFEGAFSAGDPLFAGRTNGETVWLAVSCRDYDPISVNGDLWHDIELSFDVDTRTLAPFGPGSGDPVIGWSGEYYLGSLGFPDVGLYRIVLSGVSAVSDCAADLDGSSGVDVFDLLVYLDFWFSGDAAADLDANTTVNVFDLLTYLDAWFAGC